MPPSFFKKLNTFKIMIYLFVICLIAGGFLAALSDTRELSGSNFIEKFAGLSFVILVGSLIIAFFLYKWWQAILIPLLGALAGGVSVALVGDGKRFILNIFFFLQLLALLALIYFVVEAND